MQPTHARPNAPIFPGFLRHGAQLPTCPTSPKATRTHPIQSSDICGRVARPATNQPDFLTPVDDAAAVHPDDPAYGPVSPAAAAPRAFALPTRQLPHVRPARPASFGRQSGPLLAFTMAPLGQPAPHPLLDCYGPLPKQDITSTSSYGEHFEARDITRTLSRRSPQSEAYNPHLARDVVTMGDDRT